MWEIHFEHNFKKSAMYNCHSLREHSWKLFCERRKREIEIKV